MTETAAIPAPHRLINFLPAVFRSSPELATLLAAFDATLFADSARTVPHPAGTGAAPAPARGETALSVEEQIGRIPSLLDPLTTDLEFLEWLAQWAAISLLWEARDPRTLVKSMIPLYDMRGTRDYVVAVLQMYVAGSVTVEEQERPGLALGVPGRARVGSETRLGEDPFYFHVDIKFTSVPADAPGRARLLSLARAVIDLAKPAYTHYQVSHNLTDRARGFVIAVRSRVGVDTYLFPHESAARGERP